jgi:hypothetical protein
MNMVNGAYARTAESQQPALMKFLTGVFKKPRFGEDAEQRIDEIATYMARAAAKPFSANP